MDLICQDEAKKWLQHFQNYLQINQMQKTSHLLDYLLDCQLVFQSNSDQQPSLSKKLAFIFDTYLKEDSSKPIMFSNQVLRDELSQQLSMVYNNGSYYDGPHSSYLKVLNLLKESNNDYKVWKGGLEQAYKQFISSKPKIVNDITTVLLSILWTLVLSNKSDKNTYTLLVFEDVTGLKMKDKNCRCCITCIIIMQM